MEKVISYSDFILKIQKTGRSFLLLYKNDSEQSNCALRNIRNAMRDSSDSAMLTADVSVVKDIHTVFGITSVPSLLVFADGNLINVIKGCQGTDYYKALTENTLYRTKYDSGDIAVKRVTVYSAPTCSWCNTLKSWLKQNNIQYTDVDVSRDQRVAEELVRRTGQQGVPQTDINGQIVVGFNQQRLRELLEI
jgi:glutaredoxin-like YruB-family protein